MMHHVALDLGAESGRVMLGRLAEGRLELEEVHRFPTGAMQVEGTLRWDVLGFFEQIKTGLRKVAARGIEPASLSADSWGVDYVYVKHGQPLLSQPFHYRDPRTEKQFEIVDVLAPKEEIFAETGIQFMAINTLYQLMHDGEERAEIAARADCFLNIGDYFNYLLSGVAVAEESLASTTQLYNPKTHKWSSWVIGAALEGVPERIFPPIVQSGTRLGPLTSELAADLNWPWAQVIATCSHDTGAAVAAVPAEGKAWAYLSSGTWSLLGVEAAQPVITPESRAFNFTNEAGLGGTTRLLKNIVGLWIVQECRRTWALMGENYSYEDLAQLAAEAEPLIGVIDPRAEEFSRPDGMPDKVMEFCRRTSQPVPTTPGAIIRCVYESLALLYHHTLRQVEKVSGGKIARLHIVGGGSKSELLNQMAANATGLPVIAGPAEATAIGNVLIQALALGQLKSHAEMRDVVRRSFPGKTYQPQDRADWQKALEKFAKVAVNRS